MKKIIFLCILFITSNIVISQSYQFTTTIDIEANNVKSQGRTGTCWSFSTTSFLESEIIRLTGKRIDLSEMYTVRNTYYDKAWNYIMRQGKTQFSEGGLAHDVLNSVKKYGLVPNEAYTGLNNQAVGHNHAELISILKSTLDTYISKPDKIVSPKWKQVTAHILDIYLGEKIDSFVYEGTSYTPKSFLEYTKIIPENYISFTSFNHQPFYSNFILNIPDNFSNGSFYNLPVDELFAIVNHALKKGFTVELDCDVSEKTFSSKHGIAVVPEKTEEYQESLKSIVPEKSISQEFRQKEFENQNTTDDHLMHIIGIVQDQNKAPYFKMKNSWGSDSNRVKYGGYIYMSEAYFKLKAISITIHKDAIPKKLVNFLSIN
ncbi:C1 family peptidase [Tamlana sp. 2201CG12-4]|uniref:C1 family peptidase n=1 Tax=Tamlana sp. 2201CG12-4 TaxID=3112582 RepID=UPI002DBA5C0E|nr:C1 family peptidase [Tamlana sp. 2201CG12-4]MEC3907954.1 C1 family peptidase [Tamlana sp. 2201CG12-4]